MYCKYYYLYSYTKDSYTFLYPKKALLEGIAGL
jgi:hypothetical protein